MDHGQGRDDSKGKSRACHQKKESRTYLFEFVFLFSLGKYPEVELLGHTVVLFLIS